MEGKQPKANLTTGQSVAIGVGAVLAAAAVIGGVCLGKKLYKKAQEEDWGEKLREKAGDAAETVKGKVGEVAENVKGGAKEVAADVKGGARKAKRAAEEAAEEAEDE